VFIEHGKENGSIRQIAALPYRIQDGHARVLLITSRETRRWVVPKGNPIRGLRPHEGAAQEAWEEAGVTGASCPTALGEFSYRKRRRNGTTRHITVALFPLAVWAQAEDWPERDERDTRWFDLPDAAAAVDEPELKRLIAGFRAMPPGRSVPSGGAGRAIRGLPMLGWFQSLMPKQGRFFDLFEAHARTLVAGAQALSNLLGEEGRNDECIAEIIRQEHAADDITRDVLLDVRRVFVTPFDRSAITGLIGVMDDAIDQMNATAKSIRLFDMTRFDPQMRDMAALIVESARLTAEIMPLLRDLNGNAQRLHELTERLIRLEGDADEIHEAGLKALFQAHGQDRPMAFIVGQEVFSHLERVVDKFEDIANEVQGLVIDHA